MRYKQICVNIDEEDHSLWQVQNEGKSISAFFRKSLKLELIGNAELERNNLEKKVKTLREELLFFESKLGNIEEEANTQKEQLWTQMRANNPRLTREMFNVVWEKQSEI